MSPSKTLFLDRDGVINQHPDSHYVMSWNDFAFNPGVLQAILRLSEYFNHIVVVTNQQGVGKGMMSQEDLDTIHERMVKAISGFGGRIDLVCACTDLASEPNNCRKPATVMALKAQSQFPDIDFSKSLMVGDQLTDLHFGADLGMAVALIQNPSKNVKLIPPYQDVQSFKSLQKLADFIEVNDHWFKALSSY